MSVRGGCACGAIRFESTAGPLTVRVCWCRVCQYLGAGSGTVNAMFKTEGFSVQGMPASHRFVADSGNVIHRPEAARPEMTIWTSAAPSWACFATDIPRLPGQAPPPKT